MWEWTPAQIAEIKALAQFYRGDAWLFPEKFQADLCLEKRFAWGEIQAQLQLQSQRICACRLYTDAMDAAAITELEALLRDCPLTSQALQERALSASPHHPLIPECIAWISQEIEGQEAKWD